MKDIPCVAIDYVPWLWECWIYHKVSPVSVLQKDENVNHYRPARCSSSKGSIYTIYGSDWEVSVQTHCIVIHHSKGRLHY